MSAPKPAKPDSSANSGKVTITPVAPAGVPAGMGRVRLYAHPGNPDARAAVVAKAAERARQAHSSASQPLRKGSVVAAGTVLGQVSVAPEAKAGSLRFAIQPAGDSATIDPGAVLSNWAQLQAALHPEGAKAANPLLGATASDVLLLSRSQLQRAILSDPEISIYGCGRRDIAGGLIDRRALAVIAFLARSGLEPTINALRCGQSQYNAGGALSAAYDGRTVELVGDQRREDRPPPGARLDHRPDDPHAADAPAAVRAPRNPQPDALPAVVQHPGQQRLLEPHPARLLAATARGPGGHGPGRPGARRGRGAGPGDGS